MQLILEDVFTYGRKYAILSDHIFACEMEKSTMPRYPFSEMLYTFLISYTNIISLFKILKAEITK